MPDDVKTDAVLDHAKSAQRYGKAAMLQAAQYIFVDDPTYTKEGHDRFVTEARRLTTGRDE